MNPTVENTDIMKFIYFKNLNKINLNSHKSLKWLILEKVQKALEWFIILLMNRGAYRKNSRLIK